MASLAKFTQKEICCNCSKTIPAGSTGVKYYKWGMDNGYSHTQCDDSFKDYNKIKRFDELNDLSKSVVSNAIPVAKRAMEEAKAKGCDEPTIRYRGYNSVYWQTGGSMLGHIAVEEAGLTMGIASIIER